MDVEMSLCKEMDQLEVDPDYKKLKKDIEVFMQIDDVNYRMSFNKDDNVYDVAMGFITKNALNPDYLDEIMIFVEKYDYHVDFNVDFNALKEKFLDVTKLVPECQKLSYEDIKEILLLVNVPEDVTYRQFQLLDAVLSWADDFLPPALELFSVALQIPNVRRRMCYEVLIHLIQILDKTKSKTNTFYVVKIFCNLFHFVEGKELMINFQEKICLAVKNAITSQEDVHDIVSKLHLNYTLAACKGLSVNIDVYCISILEILEIIVNSDSLFTIFKCVDTICYCVPGAFVCFMSLRLYHTLDSCSQLQREIIRSESKFCLRISKHLKTYNTDQNSCVYIKKFTRFIELPHPTVLYSYSNL
ncbi:phospholipase A-2-activating protein [Caerostris extrusa]|uniref:Phospholipase A-2-activating protein n=1 Tax=Caerostris extrusa TaxID=172846 RepID=A0AAV4UCI7_CAEEX|nr:phospholipase A-2-activating protein [Caerostris extrusa]